MEFRELNKNDIPSLLELYVQLNDENEGFNVEKSEEIWDTEIEGNKNIHYFGAVENGRVVSTCYCVIIPNLTRGGRAICFVENVVTHRDYRKQGLARKVIEMAVETARRNNCFKVILQSGSGRKEAHKFYEGIGFAGDTKKAFDMRLGDGVNK